MMSDTLPASNDEIKRSVIERFRTIEYAKHGFPDNFVHALKGKEHEKDLSLMRGEYISAWFNDMDRKSCLRAYLCGLTMETTPQEFLYVDDALKVIYLPCLIHPMRIAVNEERLETMLRGRDVSMLTDDEIKDAVMFINNSLVAIEYTMNGKHRTMAKSIYGFGYDSGLFIDDFHHREYQEISDFIHKNKEAQDY